MVLTDPVCPVGCLVLCRHIPPWVKVNHDIGTSQVQAGSTCLEGDQEDGWLLRRIKFIYVFNAIGLLRLPLNQEVVNPWLNKLFLQDGQGRRELGEQQDLMTASNLPGDQVHSSVNLTGMNMISRIE